jgi:dUTPase
MSELEAYANGAMALGSVILEDSVYKIHMSVDGQDQQLLTWVSSAFNGRPQLRNSIVRYGTSYSLDIYVDRLLDGVYAHAENHDKFSKITLTCTDVVNFRHFLRGVLDYIGVVKYHYGPSVKIAVKANGDRFGEFAKSISQHCKIPFDICNQTLKWSGVNAIDLLEWVYDHSTIHLERKLNVYRGLLWMDGRPLHQPIRLDTADNSHHRLEFWYAKSISYAPAPSKSRLSDAGWDLHIVRKLKEENGVYFYTTGIRVEPPFGYYFEVVGRSSISKTGWMLANSIGVIDPGYNSDIIVALTRTRPDAAEFQLEDSKGTPTPVKLVQIVPRRLYVMKPVEVADLSQTSRGGTGGLGGAQFGLK